MIKYILSPEELTSQQFLFQQKLNIDPEWKIHTICDKAIESMYLLEQPDKYIFCKMTCQIKKQEILKVLNYIQAIKKDEKTQTNENPPHLNAQK